jgi:hypothetical protein
MTVRFQKMTAWFSLMISSRKNRTKPQKQPQETLKKLSKNKKIEKNLQKPSKNP